MFSATLVKDGAALTVTHILKSTRTDLSFCPDLPLSEHLHYREEYVRDNREGAKTTLHMPELWHFGNSFVLQLKNGHFLISDGGGGHETRYLLDYLESLTPQGEKPVVEGWFLSHGHSDHYGALGTFFWEKGGELAGRICVEGIYFNQPDDRVYQRDPWSWLSVAEIRGAARYLRNSAGKHPPIYRPQTGLRYYFNDITVDILHAQEQLPNEDYQNEDYPGDFNDSSTWCMVTIEGQKVLLSGDGDVGAMEVLCKTYDPDYFRLTLDGARMREILINFPLYNPVDDVLIGLDEGAQIRPAAAYTHQKPVVFYGSSITQGGCASHAGNAYFNILSRRLDTDIVNLGFSSGCHGEDAMAEYLSTLDMSALVYDYDHNAGSEEELWRTHERAFRIIRERRPELPVIFISAADRMFGTPGRRAIIYQTYQNAVNAGDKNVYFIDGSAIYAPVGRDLCTVDHIHPNDVGFLMMANAVEPVLRRILAR